MSEAPAHSPYGPSSAERWLLCPASVAATKDLPDTDSDFAMEGTAAHTLSEWAREEDVLVKTYLGKKVPVKRVDGSVKEFEVDMEMVNHIQGYIDRINTQVGDQLIEERVSYEKYVPNGWGTTDAAVMQPGICINTDLKYGKGVQKYADNNVQMLCYSLGIYLEYDWLYNFERFRMIIDQPRLDHYSIAEVTKEELLKWADEVLVPGYKRTLDPDAPFVPGTVQCQFCKIRATCRARAESVMTSAVGEFENLDAAVKATTLTNEEVAKALYAIPNIKAWCKAIMAHAQTEVKQGRPVGGWKFVPGRSARVWAMDEDDIYDLWDKHDLDVGMLYTKEIVSMPQAEKVAGKKHPIWETEGLFKKVDGKPTLVPPTDKREAIAINPETEFESLEDE